MKVNVKTFATLRRFIEKESQVTVETGTTVGELLDKLTAAHPRPQKRTL